MVVVLAAAGGILAYKLAFQPEKVPLPANALFKAQERAATAQPAPVADAGPFAMDELASMNALNEKAMDRDAVMVWVSKDGSKVPETALNALKGAWSAIRGKGVKLGVYQLKAGSPDLQNIGHQVALPAVLVLSKGKGMGTVTGDITQEKLIQALVASGRAGGCGSGSGCAPGPSCPAPK